MVKEQEEEIRPLSDAETARNRALTDQTISMIAWMPEFSFLTRPEVAKLAELPPHTFKRGDVFITPDDVSNRILIILLAGECEIEKNVDIDGNLVPIRIETVHAPAVLGEIGVFSSIFQTAKVIASKRSVSLVLPANTFLDHFQKSAETRKKMPWYFAKLGIMRIKTSTINYNSLFRKYIKDPSSKPYGFMEEAEELEKIMGDDPESSEIGDSFFDSIGELLDRVDNALGQISYLDQIEDRPMPDMTQAPEAYTTPPNLSSLALAVAEPGKYKGVAMKKALSEELAKDDLSQEAPSPKELIDLLIRATHDLLTVSLIVIEANSKRTTKPGTQNMVAGFELRVKNEFDKIINKTKERFSVEHLPQKLGDDTESIILAKYMIKKVAEIQARTKEEHFEDWTDIEYSKPGVEIRDSVAMDLYHRLSGHEIIQLLIPAILNNKERYSSHKEEETASILDFLIHGYNLHYPTIEKSSPPYPV